MSNSNVGDSNYESKPLARRLTGSGIINKSPILSKEKARSKVFKLASGKSATFDFIIIPHDEIEEKTTVTLDVNGRVQQRLTEKSLKRLSNIVDHQFAPVVANRVADKYDILDGSRRRMAAITFGAGLEVLVSREEISVEDAKQLAEDIQSSIVVHSAREAGKRLEEIKKAEGLDNNQLAERKGVSVATVNRQLRAAQAREELVNFFDINELSHSNYNFLLKVEEQLQSLNVDVEEFALGLYETLDEKFTKDNQDDFIDKDTMLKIMDNAIPRKPKKAAVKTKTKILKELSKDSFIKSKVKGRKTIIEFNRIDQNLIKKVLSEIERYKFNEEDSENK